MHGVRRQWEDAVVTRIASHTVDEARDALNDLEGVDHPDRHAPLRVAARDLEALLGAAEEAP